MAIDVSITSIGSGFNRSVIDTNFTNIQAALENALSRDGTLPNSMEADIDMDSNDILNVGDINTTRLFVDGEEFVAGDVSAVGDRGWSPSFAIVSDSDRRVLQLTGYVGGEGTEPTDNVGKYVGSTQMETLIANGVDIRGAQGASGPGTGDMLAAQNLSDVADIPTAFANIKQAATTTATGVVELATEAEVVTGTDTTRATTAAGVAAAIAAQPVPAMVVLDEGTISTAATFDVVFTGYEDYRHIRIVLSQLRPVTNSTELRLRFSSDGGSSFVSSSFAYTIFREGVFSNDTNFSTTDADSSIALETALPNTSTAFYTGDLTIYDWQDSYSTLALGQFVKSNGFTVSMGSNGGYIITPQITNAIRFYMSSGNISTAKYTIYGIR